MAKKQTTNAPSESAAAPATSAAPETPVVKDTGGDAARAKIEAMQDGQRDAGEPTRAESRDSFTAQIKERMSQPGSKVPATTLASRRLPPGRAQLREHATTNWDVIPEHGTQPEHLLDPAFWSHEWKKFKQWDSVQVRAEDGSWMAELVVTDRGNLWVKMAFKPGYPLMLQVTEPDVESAIPNGYAIEWKGPHEKYVVLRGTEKLRTGFERREVAYTWLRNVLKAMAA